MTTHSSPLASADPTGEEAEPSRRTPRFDERGIALQTVIIMVVLLAIAGGIAAVLLNRAGDAQSELEQQAVTVQISAYDDSKALCEAAGYGYDDDSNTCYYKTDEQCERFDSSRPKSGGPKNKNVRGCKA